MSKKSSRRKKTAAIPATYKFPPWIIQNDSPTQEQMDILKGTKVMIGTPMYGGLCYALYANGVSKLIQYGDRLGMDIELQSLTNESLIQRGRNTIAYLFDKSKYDYLFFIDADIAFSPVDALTLILAAKMKNEPLVGATYSKKGIPWEKVRLHIKNGVRDDKLPHCLGSHVIQRADKALDFDLAVHEFFPVLYLGTGFMLISREGMDRVGKLSETYRNTHILGHPGTDRVVAYFDCKIKNDNYLSEDYLFCDRAIEAGMTPKMAPWINLAHFGTYGFEGCFMCSQQGYVHDVRHPGSPAVGKIVGSK